MNKCLGLVFFGLLIACTGWAADDGAASRPDIDKLLKAARVQKLSEDAMGQVGQMMKTSLAPYASVSGTDSANALEEKIFGIIKEAMSWDKMRDDYAKLYAETYTPEEAKALTAFYQSQTGQMFLDREPLLVQKTMTLTQKLVANFMPNAHGLSTGTNTSPAGSPSVSGTGEPIRPDIAELLKLCRCEQLNADVLTKVKGYMDQASTRAGGKTGGFDQLFKQEEDALSWDKMEGEYAQIYAEVFTPQESKELIDFYKTPTGQLMLDKAPLLLQKTMEMTQKEMAKVTPQMIAAIMPSGLGQPPAPGLPTTTLSGTYALMNRPANTEANDRIVFHPDGTCILDKDGQTGMPGKYRVSQEPSTISLAIDSGTGHAAFGYQLMRQEHVMTLTRPSTGVALIYGLIPADRQPVTFGDIQGIYYQKDSNSENVCQITPDHRFQVHYRAPDPQTHTYVEGTNQGKCTLVDGIVTYYPEQPYYGETDQYLRDVVAKHDGKGLWVIDPYEDAIVCETPATTLDLPPPPDGYKRAP